MSPVEATTFLLDLSTQVASLHESGQIHCALMTAAFERDSQGSIQLLPPHADCWLGRFPVSTEWLPPELHSIVPIQLPATIDAALATLERVGKPLDPRQIDLYQMGVLLCNVLTGEPATAYMSSLKTRMRVAPPIRPVIERALGCDGRERFANAVELRKALATVLRELNEDAADGDASESSRTKPDTTPSLIASGRGAETSIRPGAAVNDHSSSDSLPFQKLGHYEILARIGHGGMGDVYLGYERALDRHVAIKVLPADFARQPDFVRRFRDEATAAAKLVHPNIIRIHFIGDTDGYHFFAMQYVEGESLAQLLRRTPQLSVGQVLSFSMQIFSGLSAAHKLGLVHRDIKPGNVLLDQSHERVLLADFGLVKSTRTDVTGKTATGVIMGTADYMPPEQARGRAVDHRADLYAMGVLMYQMLSGRLPFEADSPTALIFQHVYEQPPPLRQAAPTVPGWLVDVVDSLLRKSPDARPQSADEVLRELRSSRPDQEREFPSEVDRWPVAAADRIADRLVPHDAAAPGRVRWWARTRDRAASLIRQHSPQLLEQLQNTQQQVGGAIAQHERRQRKLQEHVREAESVLLNLKSQGIPCTSDSLDRSAADQTTHELQHQIGEQEDLLSSLRLDLAKVELTVNQLRSQRDLLNARLRTAEAAASIASGAFRNSPVRRTWWFILMGIAGLFLTVIASLWFLRSGIQKAPTAKVPSGEMPSAGSNQEMVKDGNMPPMLIPSNSAADVEVVGQPVDLLQLVDLSRDLFSGEWRRQGTSIVGQPRSGLYLPQRTPEDYQLRLQINRRTGTDSLSVGFIMAGRQGMMAFDFGEGRLSGLYADGTEPTEFVRSGKLFTNDRPASIVLTVHPGSLHVVVDGKTILDWFGPADRLYFHGIPNRESPWLAVSNATYEVVSATMVAIRPEAVGKRPGRFESPIDILPLLDVRRDVVRGSWALGNGGLFSPNLGNSRLTLPVEVPEEYTLSATVERPVNSSNQTTLTLGFVKDGSNGQIVLINPSRVGIDAIDGQRFDRNEPSLVGNTVKLRQVSHLSCTVTKRAVRFDLDGRTLIDWQGDAKRLSLPPDWAVPDGKRLFLGASDQFRFSDLKIGPPVDPLTLPEHPAFVAGRTFDLLSLVDPERDALTGTWNKSGNSLRLMGDAEHNFLAIPSEVPAEYKLTIILSRLPGGSRDNECLFLKLPADSYTADIGIDAYGSTVSGVYLEGGDLRDNETTFSGRVIPPTGRQEITCFVRRTGLKVETPDRTIIDWPGNMERLVSTSAHATPGARIAIGSYCTGFQFDRVEIQPLEPTQVPPIPDLDADGKLLPTIDAVQAARKGKWTLTNNGLVTPSLGLGSRLRIPMVPPERYVLTAEVERMQGINEICLGLVVGGHPCSVLLDAGGNQAGLERLDGKRIFENMNLTHRFYQGGLLPTGQTVRVRCFVLPDALVVVCDDKEVIRWHGDPRRLSPEPSYLPPNYSAADQARLWLGTWDAQFLIRDLEIQPLDDQTAERIKTSFEGVFPTTSLVGLPLSPETVSLSPSKTKLGQVSESVQWQPGLVMTGYNGADLQRQQFSRIEWNIDRDFQFGVPGPGIEPDNFSVRWMGSLKVPAAGKYKFFLQHDDGGRLWINGEQLINNWGNAGEEQVEVTLKNTMNTITVDFCERQVICSVRLQWQSDSIPRETVPPTAFFHDPRLATQMRVK